MEKVDLPKAISKDKLSPGCTIDIVLSVTSVLRKITNIYKLVFAKDRPRLQDVWAPVTFWIQKSRSTQSGNTSAGEAFTNKHACIFGLLCMRLCPHAEMGAIHNAWCLTELHSLVYHESRWTSTHTQTHTLWLCARRWFQGEGGSALYRIICLGRPLLWTICRFPTRTGVIQANSWRAADGWGCGGID